LVIFAGALLDLEPGMAWVEGAGGSYRGIARTYFSCISAVRIFGMRDVVDNRNVTIAGAIVIVAVVYGFLLLKGERTAVSCKVSVFCVRNGKLITANRTRCYRSPSTSSMS